MQDKIRLILFLACLWGVSGCSQPGIFIKQFDSNEHFTPSSWETILVLPFSGEKKHRLTASEWLAFYLQKQNRYSIATPTYAEIVIVNKGMSVPQNGFSIEQARQAAQLLEVDAVLIGDVETEKRSQSPVKISLQLIDVKTGEKIASHTIGYPTWVFLWDNTQEYVRLATEVAGRDFLKILQHLAKGKSIESLTTTHALSNENRNPDDL